MLFKVFCVNYAGTWRFRKNLEKEEKRINVQRIQIHIIFEQEKKRILQKECRATSNIQIQIFTCLKAWKNII